MEVEVPIPCKDSTLWVKVSGSGFGGYGLPFTPYLNRARSRIGCYLSCRKDVKDAIRIFAEIEASLEELRGELGDDVESWTSQGRPRIGFRRETRFPLPDDESEEFRAAVAWMRDHLDRLVSTLHPLLRRKIVASS